ncbi:MAG: DNA-3-methyladenine glycosylase [Lentimicrobiaceae bacterium]|jgi:DNA-3-methyladenine glycosylase|nr:DNA-3-methyladenine glycosylase [Lentimicrobiaceae bacterium]
MLKLPSKPLSESYFLQEDVVAIAKNLIGKIILTHFDGKITSGIIAETEAYAGAIDRASHAFGNRHTQRTETMFQKGGRSYVYLCYGVHYLFNIVTNSENIPHAVLIRGMIPLEGYDTMTERVRWKSHTKYLVNGPGKVCKALEISTKLNNILLNENQIWICENIEEAIPSIISTTRVGVDYAGDDALLPYRFYRSDYKPTKP